MKLATFTYDLTTKSWSVPDLPALDSPQTLVLAFGAPEMVAHPNIFQLLRDAYPSSLVMGCSSAGVVAGTRVLDRTLSVAVARFEHSTLESAAVLARDAAGSRAAGVALGRKLGKPGLRAIFVLSEGLRIHGEDLVAGIASVVGEAVVVTGGMAGDGTRFERTWVSSSNRLQSGLIAAVALYGDRLIVGHGEQVGWTRFGPERVITRARGNVLHELDGKPATELYEPHLADRLAGLPATGRLLPLAMWHPARPLDVTVRNLLAVDSESRALIFAGEIPEGHRAQLMRTERDLLLSSAHEAAVQARRTAGPASGDLLGIAVGCVGRRLALGERVSDEVHAAASVLTPTVHLAGFYGYGEVAPDTATGRSRLYTQSLVLTLLGETGDMPGNAEVSGMPDMLGMPGPGDRAWGPEGEEVTATVLPQTSQITGGVHVSESSSGLTVTAFARELGDSAWSVPVLPALDSPRTLVLVFGAPEAREHRALLDELRRTYPGSHLIGCSTAGEIFGAEVRDRSLAVTVARFAHTDLASARVAVQDARESFQAGSALARELWRPDLRAVLVLADAMTVSSSELLRGLRSGIDESVVIAGSLAGDGPRFERTWILTHGQLEANIVAAVGFYGDHIIVGHGSRAGWDEMGPEHTVTRADGRMLFELDGKPALELYREIAGGRRGSFAPVVVRVGSRRIWRAVLGVDESARTVLLAGAVPVGARLQLVRTEAARIIDSAAESALMAKTMAGFTDSGAFAVAMSSASRRMALGDRAEQEIEAAARAFSGIRLAGFYGYGAVAPSLQPDLPAQVMSLLVLGESAQPLPAARASHGPAQAGSRAGQSASGRAPSSGPAPSSGRAPSNGSAPSSAGATRGPAVPPPGPQTAHHAQSLAGPPGAGRAVPPPSPPGASGPPGPSGPPGAGRATLPPSPPGAGRAVPPPTPPSLSGASRATLPPSLPGAGRAATPSSPPSPAGSRAPRAPRASTAPLAPAAPPTQTIPPAPTTPRGPGARASSVPAMPGAAAALDSEPPESFAIARFTYDMNQGRWSVPVLPALDSPQTLILAFGAPELSAHPEVFSELREAYPRSHILGCSTAGEIAGLQVLEGTLSVAVVRFEHTTLISSSVLVGDAAGSFPAGQVLAHKLNEPGLRAILVLAEGLEISGSELLRGINSVVDSSVVVTGGLAGDGLRFERTWVLSGDKLQGAPVAAVGLYGDHLVVGHGAEGGWEPFGPDSVITRATGNVLYELDGQPALAWYKEHLGDQAANLPATGLLFPLGLRPASDSDAFLVRTVLAIDETQQSMTFAGEAPEGMRAQILSAEFAQLIGGATSAARRARDQVETLGDSVLNLVISDVGRRVVLGDRTHEEITAAAAELPESALTCGFYAYGGFSSFRGGASELHNQTVIVTVLGESATPFTRPTSAAMQASGSRSPLGPGPRRTTVAPGAGARNAASRKSTAGDNPRAASRGATAPPTHGEERGRPAANLLPGSELSAYRRELDGISVIELAGRMNESFDGRALAASLSGTVILDLSRVERVTSFGVREWLHFMTAAEPRVDRMYLAGCSEAMVNQLVMIRSMAGSAAIVSFAAPYVCRACNQAFAHIIDCEHDVGVIQAGAPPLVQCPYCGEAAYFDDEVSAYFSFAQAHAGRPVPAVIRRALDAASRDPGPSEIAAEAIEKTVTEHVTRIRISGALDETIRWSRILDGAEGVVRFDFGEVTGVTPGGAALLQSALRSVAGSTERCEIAHCPIGVTEQLAAIRPPLSVSIVSAYVAAFCQACQLPRIALVDVAGNRSILRQGLLPSVLCKRCSSPLAFAGDRAVLKFLGQGDGRDSAAVLASRSRPAAWMVGMAALVLVCAVAGTYLVTRSAERAGAQRTTQPATQPAGAGAQSDTPAAPASAPDRVAEPAAGTAAATEPGQQASGTPAGMRVPPAWVDREFTIQGEHALVVGRGGPAADMHTAIAAAYADAVHQVLVQMVPRLQGSPVYGFVRANLDVSGNDPAAVQRVVARYEQQVGKIALLERVDAFPEERDGKVVVAAWYRMPLAGFEDAVKYYRRSDVYVGMTVAPVFPLLEARAAASGDVVVVDVEDDSPAERAGVEPGDVILEVADKFVASLEEYELAIRSAWEDTRKRRSMGLELLSKGERLRVGVKKR